MLSSPAPYPYVGSYALIEHEGETQLARIIFRREGQVVVSLPLRQDAGGNLAVDPDRLRDGTPLTPQEEREFHDLDRALRGKSGRTAKQRHMMARRDALKGRILWAPFLSDQLHKLRKAEAGPAPRLAWMGAAQNGRAA